MTERTTGKQTPTQILTEAFQYNRVTTLPEARRIGQLAVEAAIFIGPNGSKNELGLAAGAARRASKVINRLTSNIPDYNYAYVRAKSSNRSWRENVGWPKDIPADRVKRHKGTRTHIAKPWY